MAILINENNALEAWQAGCRYLAKENDAFNVITTISDPTYFDDQWIIHYNPRLFNERASSLSDVVNTIFPRKLFRAQVDQREDLYKKFKARHERAAKIHLRTKKSWGTYFNRLIQFGDNEINQLEQIITSLNNRTHNYKASLVIHLSSADTDSLIKTLGNPCLQYLAFLCPDADRLSLLAIYRNHDYFHKAFGNFIGLGKLLEFVCSQTNRQAESLVCHSAHAYFECRKNDLIKLARIH